MSRTRMHEGRVLGTVNNRHGNKIIQKEVTVPCMRCTNGFTCVMTTKAPNYCPECREIVRKEKAVRDHERMQRIRAMTPDELRQKTRRKIPYAGSK